MSTTRLNLIHDGDMIAPFFRIEGKFAGHYICLGELNGQFNPEIPYDAPRIYLCTSPKPLASKADADFWLKGTYPYVETTADDGALLHHDIKAYLRDCYEAGDRVAWIEYEEAE